MLRDKLKILTERMKNAIKNNWENNLASYDDKNNLLKISKIEIDNEDLERGEALHRKLSRNPEGEEK